MNKYFNKENTYKEPVFIKFETPKRIRISELNDFYDKYTPFPCSYVWAIQCFEYGDFDNNAVAVCESITVDPRYSKVFREDTGIYKKGQTNFNVKTSFWHYKKDEPFWTKPLKHGYDSFSFGTTVNYIDEIEIKVDGVFVISQTDKEKIEKKYFSLRNN